MVTSNHAIGLVTARKARQHRVEFQIIIIWRVNTTRITNTRRFPQGRPSLTGRSAKTPKNCCSLSGVNLRFPSARFLWKMVFFRSGRGPRARSPVHAVSCCHHPVPLDQGPSAGVVPAAAVVILQGDLGGDTVRGEAWGSPQVAPSPWLLPTRTHLRGPGVRARFAPSDHPLRPIRHWLGAASCRQKGGDGSSPPVPRARGVNCNEGSSAANEPESPGNWDLPQRVRVARSRSCSIVVITSELGPL